MTSCKAILSLAVLLLASVPLALAQGTYTQIDYPGAVTTVCWGVDTAGDISGSYLDASNVVHGFLLIGGVYTTVDYPGATITQLFGLNDEGQVVGAYDTAGFVYDIHAQTFTDVRDPISPKTVPLAINNAGTIAGYFQKGSGIIGFELVGSAYKVILPPGQTNSSGYGITSSGEVVGTADIVGQNGMINFSFESGKYRRLGFPKGDSPTTYGVNPAGTILVGQFSASGITEGFLYQNRALQSLLFPESTLTAAYSINDGGEIVGAFVDSNNKGHGFTWTPPADAEKK